MKQIKYQTQGTCARQIHITIDGDTVVRVEFVGGCTGNAQGIAALAAGCLVDDLIDRLAGIQCRNGTSCPDQLAQALEAAKTEAAPGNGKPAEKRKTGGRAG